MQSSTATIIHVDFRAGRVSAAADPLAGMPATQSLGLQIVVMRDATRELSSRVSTMRDAASNLQGLARDMRRQNETLTTIMRDMSGKLQKADLDGLCRKIRTELDALAG